MSATNRGSARQVQAGSPHSQRGLIVSLLMVALLRGLIYLVVFPPWQHYDEPTHFEYVRLIAERSQLPSPGDVDLQMRLEIAASMQAAGFWKGIEQPVIDFWSDEPAWIGVSELEHPPLYYVLAAITQVIAAHQSVEAQLYLARLSSILLGLVVIIASYGIVAEVFPRRRLLPFAVATFVAFLPPFTDLMSSVSNDSGAAAAAALLLWACLRAIRRGITLRRAVVILLLAGMCVGMKSTSGAVALVALLALAGGFVLRWRRRWLWIGLAVAIPAFCIAAFTLSGYAAHWYSENPIVARNRVATEAPSGSSALLLSAGSENRPRVVFQELKRSQSRPLRGQDVSYGAWLKTGDASGGLVALSLHDGVRNHWHRVWATPQWQFYAFSTTINPKSTGLAAYVLIPEHEDAAQTVYADELILVMGSLPTDEMLGDPGQQGTIVLSDGQQLPNLLRNASAENQWPALRTWLGSQSISGYPLAVAFHSFWEWTRTGWAYGKGSLLLFKSFWGTFGWNHLTSSTGYFWIAGLATIGAAMGVGLWLLRHLKSRRRLEAWQWHALAVLGIALLAGWVGAVLRMHPVFTTRRLTWPAARYAIPALVPTVMVLGFGLSEIVPRGLHRVFAWTALLGWIAADAVAVLSVIIPYYYG